MWELPTRDWEWTMHVNVISQVYAMKRIIPIPDIFAAILNVASIVGLVDTPGIVSASLLASV